MFLDEARLAARIRHMNVVPTLDISDSPGDGYFLVMEYIEGESLAHQLKTGGHLTPERTEHIVSQIGSSLHEAHELGIVHRDLKPENIFICYDKDGTEHVKLLDFGLARAHITDAVLNSSERGGTPEFAAPEQFDGAAPAPGIASRIMPPR